MTSFNLPSLVDLTPVMAVFATLAGSMFSTTNILQWLRNVLLDRLTAGMADVQRNDILRGVLFVMNYAVILGIALFFRFALSPNLLLAVLVGAVGATVGAHLSYGYTQKSAPQAPEIDPSVYTAAPLPPTDTPASAALDPAA